MGDLLQIPQNTSIMQKNIHSEEVFLKEALHCARQTERHLKNQIKLIEKRLAELQKTAADLDCKMIAESLEQVA